MEIRNLEDLTRSLDLTDVRYSADGKTVRRQLIPYFKKMYPDADLPMPEDWVDGGMPPPSPDEFLEEAKPARRKA